MLATESESTLRTSHPLPPDMPFCRVVDGFLSPAECDALIAAAEARGFASAASDYPPSYRTNDRQVLDDEALARRLLQRLRIHVQQTLPATGPQGSIRTLDSINARFRLCRYRPGQSFGLHQDGVHHRGDGLRSALTFMVYLTDGASFEGGDTVFHDGGPGTPARAIGRVRPRAGTLIVFDHALWHSGEIVLGGTKHVLRSDILYREHADVAGEAHRGYVWALERLSDSRFASGGRDASIRIWADDGRCVGSLQGHARSVLGLAALGGGRLASVSRDRSLRLWQLDAGRCTAVVEGAHTAAILCVVALPDGSLATAGADGAVRRWSGEGRSLGTLTSTSGWIWALASLPGGRLAGACEDGAIRMWDLATGACTATLQGDAPLRTLVASADGAWLVSGDASGRVLQRRACGNGWTVARSARVHAAAVRRVRIVGEALLASVGEDGAVRVAPLGEGVARRLGTHANFATDVVRVGDALFSCGYDGRIRRLDEGDE